MADPRRDPKVLAAAAKSTLNTPLDDLALSSLDRIQLMMELEQRTGAAIDESQFASARTVGDLARVRPAVDGEPSNFPSGIAPPPRDGCGESRCPV